MCSHVIEGSTDERYFALKHRENSGDADYKIVRIQKATRVGEQDVKSYLLFDYECNHLLRTSPMNDKDHTTQATLGAVPATGVFTIQCVAIRSLHVSTLYFILAQSDS